MPVLTIPDPGLVVLIGAAGSGKSTFAARHFHPSEILSSDAFRALIAGNEGDQTATRAAFGRLHRELTRRLAGRRFTVVVATNLERSARRALITRARSAGLPAVAIVLDLPAATVLGRNAGRTGRVVDEFVVRRHLDRLRDAVDGSGRRLSAEGFDQVSILRDPLELDAISIMRRTG